MAELDEKRINETMLIHIGDTVQVINGEHYGTIGEVLYGRTDWSSDKKKVNSYVTIRRRTDGERIEVNLRWLVRINVIDAGRYMKENILTDGV